MRFTHELPLLQRRNWEEADWGLPTAENNKAFANTLMNALQSGFTLPVSQGLKEIGETLDSRVEKCVTEVLSDLITKGVVRNLRPFGKPRFLVSETFTVVCETVVEADDIYVAEMKADEGIPEHDDVFSGHAVVSSYECVETAVVPMKWDGWEWIPVRD